MPTMPNARAPTLLKRPPARRNVIADESATRDSTSGTTPALPDRLGDPPGLQAVLEEVGRGEERLDVADVLFAKLRATASATARNPRTEGIGSSTTRPRGNGKSR
jgi:hypothetical protein